MFISQMSNIFYLFHSKFTFFAVTFRLLSAIFFRRLPLDGDTVVILHSSITLVCALHGRALGSSSEEHSKYVRVGIGPHVGPISVFGFSYPYHFFDASCSPVRLPVYKHGPLPVYICMMIS